MPSLARKWLWFFAYWLAGVIVIGTIAYAIKLVLV